MLVNVSDLVFQKIESRYEFAPGGVADYYHFADSIIGRFKVFPLRYKTGVKIFIPGRSRPIVTDDLEDAAKLCTEHYLEELQKKGFEVVENAVEITPEIAEILIFFIKGALSRNSDQLSADHLEPLYDRCREIMEEQK